MLIICVVIPIVLYAGFVFVRNLKTYNSLQDQLEKANEELYDVKQENEQLKQRIEQLTTLHEIGRLLTSDLKLDRVLTRVVGAAVFITKAEEGALMLLDERTDELYVRAHKGLGEKFARRLRIRVEDSIAGEAVKTGEPRRLTSRDRVLKVVTGLIVNAILYVPMTIKGRVIGMLSVDNRTFDRPFTEDDEHLLSYLHQ